MTNASIRGVRVWNSHARFEISHARSEIWKSHTRVSHARFDCFSLVNLAKIGESCFHESEYQKSFLDILFREIKLPLSKSPTGPKQGGGINPLFLIHFLDFPPRNKKKTKFSLGFAAIIFRKKVWCINLGCLILRDKSSNVGCEKCIEKWELRNLFFLLIRITTPTKLTTVMFREILAPEIENVSGGSVRLEMFRSAHLAKSDDPLMSNIQSLDYHNLLNLGLTYFLLYDTTLWRFDIFYICDSYFRIHWNILITILANVIDIHIYQNMTVRARYQDFQDQESHYLWSPEPRLNILTNLQMPPIRLLSIRVRSFVAC